ncbi:hypothetical protein EV426DRAFT_611608 [Tirmania nivea]|nr:hypothetical protein EV426DRAFT_611608 [Tirmania nivea]
MADVSKPPKAELDYQLVSSPGVIRNYAPKLKAFEHLPAVNRATTDSKGINTILFIGGLGDDILSPHYVHKKVVPAIYSDEELAGWRVAEVGTSSSASGWGTGSVERDAEELAKCVYYYKTIRPTGKVVVMGHSTGCQDIFYMMTRVSPAPPVDGIILQAPISDREALTPLTPSATLFTIASSLVMAGPSPGHPNAPGGRTILPIELTSQIFGWHRAISASRWFSLTAPPHPVTGVPTGEEDFFSSDFSENVIRKYTWGRLKPDDAKVLVLYSEEDEWVPAEIDKQRLVATWIKIMKEKGVRVDEKNSGVIEEANHDLSEVEESVMEDVLGRIKSFLGWVGEGETMDTSG